jgi:PHP-associated
MFTAIQLDLHTHMKIAKRTPFQRLDVLHIADRLRRLGFAGLAITEHAHGHGSWEMYDSLLEDHPYQHGRFEINGVCFYSGLELTLAEYVDILFIAPLDELRRLDNAFGIALTAGYHPDVHELADRLDELDLDTVRIAAHPFRDDKPADQLPKALLGTLIDAVEINGRYTSASCVKQVNALADRLDVPIVGGSDAHTWPQLGAAGCEVEATSDQFCDVRDAILAGRVKATTNEQAIRMANTADRLKKRRKARLPRLPKLPRTDPKTPTSIV